MANIEALRQLQRVVRDAPEELFDMLTIASEETCGTVHCAAGWAVVDPWFMEQGLYLRNAWSIRHRQQTDGWGAHAMAKVLGMSVDDADELFMFNGHQWYGILGKEVTQQMFIDKVDQIIAEAEGATDAD